MYLHIANLETAVSISLHRVDHLVHPGRLARHVCGNSRSPGPAKYIYILVCTCHNCFWTRTCCIWNVDQDGYLPGYNVNLKCGAPQHQVQEWRIENQEQVWCIEVSDDVVGRLNTARQMRPLSRILTVDGLFCCLTMTLQFLLGEISAKS